MIFNSMQWFDPIALYFMGMSLFLNGLIVYLWHKKFYQKLGLKTYQAIQRIHLNETPRLGGFIFILSLVSFVLYSNVNESILVLKVVLISLIPIIVIGLKEDLFHNVEPAVRLIALFLVGWLFKVQFIGSLPNLADVPLISKFLMLQGGVTLFYILSMTAIANGMNLIDGVNGLCFAVILSILGALLFLSHKTNDIAMLSAIFSVILILAPFMVMNYPYGKIFLGDLGAYSLGFIVSMLTIIFFGRHPEISPWGAVLILIYPSTEVVFSILRRIRKSVPIFHADTAHLHLKIYNFFRLQIRDRKLANSLVMPTLSILWLFPLITITFVYTKSDFILISIILFVIIYNLIYLLIPKTID
jgi:UDP-GlcNAc:undecaprenyl-phosphate GlcNAc-1-phosphate transferase